MLSKFFNSARNLFVPPPQASNHEYAVDGAAEAEMVTTRSRNTSQEDGSGEENTIVVEMPSSSRKRSRKNVEESEDDGEEEEEVVVPAKKQKILPLRERDEVGVNRHTRVVVEIPVMSLPVDVRSPRADLEEDVEEFGEESEDDEAVEEIQKEPLRLEIADSESDGEEEDDETPEPELPSNKKARPSKFIEEPLSTPASTKPKHKRFGSEELEVEPEFFSTAAEIVDSDEESSDDDAPEVVGAQDAMERAQSKAREAAEAAEE
jgi:U3 small nucleolar RNA-associated protein 16